jgi:hypothetical protein
LSRGLDKVAKIGYNRSRRLYVLSMRICRKRLALDIEQMFWYN